MGKVTDISNQTFNQWTVLRFVETRRRKAFWECRCACGTVREVSGDTLRDGTSKSCGCIGRTRPTDNLDLRAMTFGRWTVVSKAHYQKYQYWNCECSCGTKRAVEGRALRSGTSTSCGRCTRSRIKHGLYSTPEYGIWLAMHDRCRNPHVRNYHNYGGRGVSVCDRWRSFAFFYEDMGPRPSPKHSIDRIDNDGNYDPDNCRWATRAEQNRNKSNNHFLTVRGETLPITDFCERHHMSLSTVSYRIRKLGWTAEQALTTPPRMTP